jgi:hypothetical protein
MEILFFSITVVADVRKRACHLAMQFKEKGKETERGITKITKYQTISIAL